MSGISPRAPFPLYSALPASPCLLYCHVVPIPTLSRERVTLSTSFTSDDPPFPQFPLFSLPPSPLPLSSHFYRCSPTALPVGFIREAKGARDSYSLRKRAREKEREKEERGLFFLKTETRTVRVLRVLRRTCSPVRYVMVDEGGRRSRGKNGWRTTPRKTRKCGVA